MSERVRGIPSEGGLAALLFRLPDRSKRAALEEARLQFELSSGRPIDLTVRYTSTWPTELQQALFRLDPQRWFDGLPPFAKQFLERETLVAEGETHRLGESPLDPNESRIRTGRGKDAWMSVRSLANYLEGLPRSPDDRIRSR